MGKDPKQEPNSEVSHIFSPEYSHETPFFDEKTQNYWQHQRDAYNIPIASNPYESFSVLPAPPVRNTAALRKSIHRKSIFLMIAITLVLLVSISSVAHIYFQGLQPVSHPISHPSSYPTTNTTFQSLPGTWVQCAAEAATCSFSGTMTVAFGANGKFNYATASSSIVCANASFGGDPIENTSKTCYTEPVPQATNLWSPCAAEYATCSLEGTITLSIFNRTMYLNFICLNNWIETF